MEGKFSYQTGFVSGRMWMQRQKCLFSVRTLCWSCTLLSVSLSWCSHLHCKATNASRRPGTLKTRQAQGNPTSRAEIVKLKSLIYWQAHPQDLFHWHTLKTHQVHANALACELMSQGIPLVRLTTTWSSFLGHEGFWDSCARYLHCLWAFRSLMSFAQC